ncbi:acyl carrier protein [Aurantibacter crassamenti]|uniref:acyl carrier protein n=1 Tax=Aurantibacter crassamenti TaxID=1837375 RepID=UPI00193AC98F|nr:acyl carrier protein [Aurantibacter crassamenti]MBM1106802.1 acyl carrier protein [Aurantibacter crassamenti]
MTEIILEYISKILSNEQLEDELQAEDDLLGGGILDSLGMMKLILFIEEKFNVKVPPEDMTIENFMTVDHITTYLNKK